MDPASAKAVVTGGASGLGLATATRIVEAGGQVTLLDINQEQGEAAARALGHGAFFIRTDVSDEKSVDAAIAGAVKSMEGMTMLVNCAGVLGAAKVLGREGPMDGSVFRRTIDVNLVGSFFAIKAAVSHMQHNEPNPDGERGVVISTASVAAYEGQIGQAAYSASKAGIVGMALPIAREMARFGIRVNSICPGIFMTPMVAGMPEHIQQSLGAQVPFPSRLGKPEEFADLVACIYRNPMINGEAIRLDGAIRMQPK